MICAACHTTFCFSHRLLVYAPGSPHENMTCPEYDSYLADPLHFKSAYQREQDAALRERREAECVARAGERVHRIMSERRAASDARAGRAAAAAREERERRERARREQERYEEERRRTALLRRRRADDVARKRAENAQSETMVTQTTKACPRCRVRIEKNEGCMHMTCEYCPSFRD